MNRISSIFLMALTIGITICNSCNNKAKTVNSTSITVAQWGQEKYLIYLPFYIAQKKGFFKDEGLDIAIKFSGNDDQVFATVLKGEAQFGIGDPVFTAISREKGANGKVVAAIVNGVALWGVTNNPKIPQITSADQLAGLRIGTFPQPSTTYTLIKNTITQGGDKLKNTKIVEAPIGSQIALLENKSADIAMELEPAASIDESNGYRVVYSLPQFFGDFSFTGLTTTDDFIKQNPEIVQKMVNAIEKACRYAHSDVEGTIKVAQSLFPTQKPEVIAKAVRRMISENTLPQHALTSVQGWDKAINVRVQVGDLKPANNANLSLDNSFAEKAMSAK